MAVMMMMMMVVMVTKVVIFQAHNVTWNLEKSAFACVRPKLMPSRLDLLVSKFDRGREGCSEKMDETDFCINSVHFVLKQVDDEQCMFSCDLIEVCSSIYVATVYRWPSFPSRTWGSFLCSRTFTRAVSSNRQSISLSPSRDRFKGGSSSLVKLMMVHLDRSKH